MKYKMTKGLLILALALSLTGCRESKEALGLRSEGIELIQSGNYAEAVELFNSALSEGDGIVDDFEKDILKYRAEAELRMGDYEAAVKSYEVIADVEKDKTEVMGFLAVAKAHLGDAEGALEALDKAGKTEQAAEMGSLAAMALLENGKAEEAEQLLNRLLEFASGESRKSIEYNLIAIKEKKGDFGQALQALNAYAEAYGTNEEITKEIAFLKSRLK